MGQAKQRGDRATRVASAQLRNQMREPGTVSCQTCGAALSAFALTEVTAAGALWECRCACGVLTGAFVPSSHTDQDRVLREARQRLAAVAKQDPANRHKLSLAFAPGPA